MRNKISHSGVIDSIEDGCVHVRIVQTSACAACKAASYCNASESKEKIIDVFCNTADSRFTTGQAVTVVASREVAARALMLGFGLPLVVLLVVLLAAQLLTGNEVHAALAGLLALVPYYGALYLLRSRIGERLAFSIE